MPEKKRTLVKVLVTYELDGNEKFSRESIREDCKEMRDGRYPLVISAHGSRMSEGEPHGFGYKVVGCRITR